MKAYLECFSCGKHSTFNLEGQAKCPHCGCERCGRLELTEGRPPSWFKKSKKDNFFTRLLRGKRDA